MDFEKLTDEQLVSLSQNGEKSAQEFLIRRFEKVILDASSRFFILGFDRDDLIQEARLGFFRALMSYDPSSEASFKTYAGVCVKNQLTSILRRSTAAFRAEPKDMIRLGDENMADDVVDYSSNPEARMVSKDYSAAVNSARKSLSKIESSVLELYLSGLSYDAIAQRLSVSKKTVDNRLQSVKRKLKRALDSL